MAKRICAIIILLLMIVTAVLACTYKAKDKPMLTTAAHRPPHEQLGVVYIDDEAIAMAGSPSADPEMRKLAVDAYENTNIYRASQGLPTLIWSERLAKDAIVRAEEIESLFSHTRPNKTDWYTVDSEYMYGENLAQGYSTSESVVDAWIKSPSHKANIVDTEFITCGISAWRGNDGNIYIAQEFGY